MKAIQCTEATAEGKAVHPRAGDHDVSRVQHEPLHPVQAVYRGMPVWGHQRR